MMINLLIVLVELESLPCTAGLRRKEMAVYCRASGTGALLIDADFIYIVGAKQ